jgi:hypothetical protein
MLLHFSFIQITFFFAIITFFATFIAAFELKGQLPSLLEPALIEPIENYFQNFAGAVVFFSNPIY